MDTFGVSPNLSSLVDLDHLLWICDENPPLIGVAIPPGIIGVSANPAWCGVGVSLIIWIRRFMSHLVLVREVVEAFPNREGVPCTFTRFVLQLVFGFKSYEIHIVFIEIVVTLLRLLSKTLIFSRFFSIMTSL